MCKGVLIGMERYARQYIFSKIGKEGQQRLLDSRVTIIGMGALGTVAANNMCRAGIGHIRLVDRDYVEITNLQRQILFCEEDALQQIPKAIAAYNHLSAVNSEMTIEPIVTDVNSGNIESLILGSNVVIDATDNLEIRMLINEACHKHSIPWVHGGAIGSMGTTFNVLPNPEGACLACYMTDINANSPDTCSTFGVINPATSIVASLQTTEAIKILLNSQDIRKELLMMDFWESTFTKIEIFKGEDCPVCVQKKYTRLNSGVGTYTTSICGTNSIQVTPTTQQKNVDFDTLAENLKKIGTVKHNAYTLTFSDSKYEIVLFQDGRAMIKNAIDENNAKTIYNEYIGL